MANFVKSLVGRLGLLGELMAYLWRERRLGILIIIFFLALLSLLVVAANSGSVAPFIYTLF